MDLLESKIVTIYKWLPWDGSLMAIWQYVSSFCDSLADTLTIEPPAWWFSSDDLLLILILLFPLVFHANQIWLMNESMHLVHALVKHAVRHVCCSWTWSSFIIFWILGVFFKVFWIFIVVHKDAIILSHISNQIFDDQSLVQAVNNICGLS